MKRIFVTVLLTLTLAMALSAQRGPGPQGPPRPADGGPGRRGQPPDAAGALKTALDLTDAQVTAVKALMQTRQERAAALRTEADAKRQALDALLDAASPNPTAVGNAAIALRVSEKKMQAERDWFLTELKKLLTGTQQATLDTLIAAGAPIPGLGGPGGPRGGPRGRGPGGR